MLFQVKARYIIVHNQPDSHDNALFAQMEKTSNHKQIQYF